MQPVILVRYGEIHLKGANRPFFENLLIRAMRRAVNAYEGAEVKKGDGRYYVRGLSKDQIAPAMEDLCRVFGIHSVSPALEMEKEKDVMYEAAAAEMRRYMEKYNMAKATFKVEVKRQDKRYPMKSMDVAADVGGYILDNVPGVSVDVRNPMVRVYLEIRERAYVYVDIIKGQGGMPLGSNGKAALLLSGGIDSPVAGYMVAKRGVNLEAVHYHSFPYTSERAKEKVITLARLVSRYTGPIKLHIVSFTEIQMEIYEKCPEEQLTVIMRRFMMKLAERIAKENDCKALITGESIGQVASQTIESLHVTNSAVELPVFRPLIGMDKDEIIDRAKAIGTFETSIEPYEDCCTVFVPKHPVTRPALEKIEKSEKLLDCEALIERAMQTVETIVVE
ncbi:MAG: tRNA 4-thiouridine(8) synthase ThiI [Christensenellaceae bacterium]|nr:tRNA 4-thiouridine(8) synthase ThiI [Christensenellaceae bacterium]